MLHCRRWTWSTLLVLCAGASTLRAEGPVDGRVDFIRQIRPLLSDRCFHCHGPDAAHREADLRLDAAGELVTDHADAGGVIVRGRPQESPLFQRITAGDEGRMPPPESGRELSPGERDLIRRWIEQGAESATHWSFIPPRSPPLPVVQDPAWPRNGIDRFVLAEMERQGLSPSPEADRETLIRRATLDLTGLPPTPEEVDAFLAETALGAYERLVDRLLDSERYGERMAVEWLDAARYADTNGYQLDTDRSMWRWRDWVISAFNRNLPYDRFTIEQLAGDLLPDPTLDQLIATGFNRNHRINSEGGSLPEEFLIENVVDRVDTTATVWLGLTMVCARCHDHKYDPVSQREFYEFFAFFHNVPEQGTGPRQGNSGPELAAPTTEQRAGQQALERELAAVDRMLAEREESLADLQADWERQASIETRADLAGELVLHLEFDGDLRDSASQETPGVPLGGEIRFGAGLLGQGAEFDGSVCVALEGAGDFEGDHPFSYGGWVRGPQDASGPLIARIGSDADGPGHRLRLDSGVVWFELLSEESDHAVIVQLGEPLPPDRWQHLFVTYDGTRKAKGVRLYVDGVRRQTKAVVNSLGPRSIRVPAPLGVGGHGRSRRFTGFLDDVRVYSRELSRTEVVELAGTVPARSILAAPEEDRTPPQAEVLRRYYLERHAPVDYRALLDERAAVEGRIEQLTAGFPATMVMREMESPRETSILVRGEYDQPGEPVSAGVPAFLPAMDPDLPRNRLGLARWLVDPGHPLTARVAVNRYWQMYFGTGLVGTSEDFGSQGGLPSHPKLLDWLATEFVRLGWDVKGMQKLIVTSATYRQRSDVTPRHLEADPENRLLARAPRLRLPAESIRDQALSLGGLLVEQVGGASVRPYQPEGLWEELTAGRIEGDRYVMDSGPDLYRRSLYTFWKRTIPPPALAVFDAPSRETCVVRRSQTSTPLQALTLLNDVTFVEAARGLAQRMLRDGGETAAERVRFAFRAATARSPRPAEETSLLGALKRYRARFERDPAAAEALLSVGESPRDEALDSIEHAACTVLASVILNFDATITKE